MSVASMWPKQGPTCQIEWATVHALAKAKLSQLVFAGEKVFPEVEVCDLLSFRSHNICYMVVGDSHCGCHLHSKLGIPADCLKKSKDNQFH